MADVVYHNFLVRIGEKAIDFEGDTTKVALLTSAYTPEQDNTSWSDVSAAELADGNGYTAGGVEVSGNVEDDDSGNLAKYDISNPSWTANSGSIGPVRYGVLVDTTTDDLVYLFDFTEEKTAADGADFLIQIDTDGLMTMAQA